MYLTNVCYKYTYILNILYTIFILTFFLNVYCLTNLEKLKQ